MAPKRWLECPWHSQTVIGGINKNKRINYKDLFIASKTFLDSKHKIPEKYKYLPSYVLELEKIFQVIKRKLFKY